MSLNIEINSDRYSPSSQGSEAHSPGADRSAALAKENELLRRELLAHKKAMAAQNQAYQQSVASLLQRSKHTEQSLRDLGNTAVQLNQANQTIQNYNTLLSAQNKNLDRSKTIWRAVAVFALVMWIYNQFRFSGCKS